MKTEKKSSVFFKSQKKAVQSIIKKIEVENKETSDPNEINNEINRFFKKLFAKTLQKSLPKVNNFFYNIIFTY